MKTASRRLGSSCVTRGIRVDVAPQYLREQSDPDAGKFVFSYRIRVTNEGAVAAQLVSRHWIIVDADGERHDVRGEGVVGQQPLLGPGQSFEYSSYCPLETPWGTMEGTYAFRTDDGATFDAVVARFYLAAE
jgi:ApaG protein